MYGCIEIVQSKQFHFSMLNVSRKCIYSCVQIVQLKQLVTFFHAECESSKQLLFFLKFLSHMNRNVCGGRGGECVAI